MKKIIALLLVLSTLLSLTACGGKKEEPAAETPTEVTEATTPTPVVDMTPHVIEGKQAFWDQIFKKSTIQTASDSFLLSPHAVRLQMVNKTNKRAIVFLIRNCVYFSNFLLII